MRVLDWPDRGLGRYVVAARISGEAGGWLTLTWPGYTGVLQAMAPGRFAAALNQAPMEQPVGALPLDWLLNRAKVWRQPHLTPAHLLQRVFEGAGGFAEAKEMLTKALIALPTIYTLAGLAPEETCVIERLPEDAHFIDGAACATNDWQAPGWSGRPRVADNRARLEGMRSARPELDGSFDWLRPPILNRRTRLVLVADAARATVVAQGYEEDGAATAILTATESR